MSLNDLTSGPADDVADYLNQAPRVTVADLTSALINALRRIDTLEARVFELLNTPPVVETDPDATAAHRKGGG